MDWFQINEKNPEIDALFTTNNDKSEKKTIEPVGSKQETRNEASIVTETTSEENEPSILENKSLPKAKESIKKKPLRDINEIKKNISEIESKSTNTDIEKEKCTVFIGNLTTKVLEKPIEKEFLALFATHGKIVSHRFRSIAFSANLSKKDAFLAKKIHDARDTLHAYIVFESESQAKSALALNSAVFHEKVLRVDSADANSSRDYKRCVFIGNLKFDLNDQTVYDYFSQAGEIDYCRIVRDKKNNVGKGFGYVQFKERASVSLALALDGTMLDGRSVRVSRAKATGEKSNNAIAKKSINNASIDKKSIGKGKKSVVVGEGYRAKRGEVVLKPRKTKKRITKRSSTYKKNKKK